MDVLMVVKLTHYACHWLVYICMHRGYVASALASTTCLPRSPHCQVERVVQCEHVMPPLSSSVSASLAVETVLGTAVAPRLLFGGSRDGLTTESFLPSPVKSKAGDVLCCVGVYAGVTWKGDSDYCQIFLH